MYIFILRGLWNTVFQLDGAYVCEPRDRLSTCSRSSLPFMQCMLGYIPSPVALSRICGYTELADGWMDCDDKVNWRIGVSRLIDWDRI